MTPARNKPTDGAMRAAKQIHNLSFLQSTAEIIDRETGVRELADNSGKHHHRSRRSH